jgi:hypothetical protein
MLRLISLTLLGCLFMNFNVMAVACNPCDEQRTACEKKYKGQQAQNCAAEWKNCAQQHSCSLCPTCDDPYKECLSKNKNDLQSCRVNIETCYKTNNCSQCKPCEDKYIECRQTNHTDNYCVPLAQGCYYQNKCPLPFYLK